MTPNITKHDLGHLQVPQSKLPGDQIKYVCGWVIEVGGEGSVLISDHVPLHFIHFLNDQPGHVFLAQQTYMCMCTSLQTHICCNLSLNLGRTYVET